MLKKILLFGFIALSSWKADASFPPPLPEQFYVTQRWFSLTLSFDIECPDYKMGCVHRRFFSFRTQYDFYDSDENLQAKAKLRWISFMPIFDLTDEFDQPLGRVEEHFFTFFNTFDIISPDDKVQAVAKLNFMGTQYTLTDPTTNEVMATLSRSFFRLKDNWSVEILRPDLFEGRKIDPRLFITVMAFQTDMENWRKKQQ